MAESNAKTDIEALKQRALKITEALYRTTDIMFDGEPLKWSLRQSAIDIMNLVSSLNSGGQIREAEKLETMCRNLFLKLELASSGTYISRMNFEVLKREYSVLNNTIVEQSKTPILLDLPVSKQSVPIYRTTDDISDIVSDREVMTDIKQVQQEEPRKEIEKGIEAKEEDTDRKSVIVSALKTSGPSSVSDVARLFNGTIGEKTVQRELNGLVEVGVIKKEGEKRWRRYFI